MMGILDFQSPDQIGGLLNGLPAAWQYQNPQDALDQKRFIDGLMQNPTDGFALPAADDSPFGPVPHAAVPKPPGIFDTGTASIPAAPASAPQLAPFLAVQPPQQIPPTPPAFGANATPVPFAPGPVTEQPPAGPATNWPSAGRPPAASGASAPDRTVSIGRQADGSLYDMPVFGRAENNSAVPGTAAPAALSAEPSLGDRLAAGFNGFANGGSSHGLLGALSGGIEGYANGGVNLTAKALLAKGAAPADVQAALNNQDLMKALINQYYGPKASGATGIGNNPNLNPTRRAPAAGSIQNGYRFKGGNPADRNNWEQH
jgi:hypothetical protein